MSWWKYFSPDPTITTTTNIFGEDVEGAFGDDVKAKFGYPFQGEGPDAPWDEGRTEYPQETEPDWGGVGQPNYDKIQDIYRQAQYNDPRFQHLDKMLMAGWQGERDALEGVLTAPSQAALAQNIAVSDASSLGIAGHGAKNAAAAAAGLNMQGQAGSQAIQQGGQQRAAEDQLKLQAMQELAERRNQYLLSANDLYTRKMGGLVPMWQDYKNQMLSLNLAEDDLDSAMLGMHVGEGIETAGEAASYAGRMTGEDYSDERLKEDVKSATEPEEKKGPSPLSMLGPIGNKLAGVGRALQQPRYYAPGFISYAPDDLRGSIYRRQIVSGIETKEDVKPTGEVASAEGDTPMPPSDGLPPDMAQAYASQYIRSEPLLVQKLRTGEINQQEALLHAAVQAERDGKYALARQINNLAAKSPMREEVTDPYGRDPYKVLRDRHNALNEQEAAASLVGLSPVYGPTNRFEGYQPGRGIVYRPNQKPGDELFQGDFYETHYPEPQQLQMEQEREYGDKPWQNDQAMRELSTIEPISYRYNEKADKLLGRKVSGQRREGLSADQAAEHNPEIVGEHNGFKTIKEDEGLGKSIAAHAQNSRKILEIEDEVKSLLEMFA